MADENRNVTAHFMCLVVLEGKNKPAEKGDKRSDVAISKLFDWLVSF